MKKRIRSILLASMMLLSILSMTVFAGDVLTEPVLKMVLENKDETPVYVTEWQIEMFDGFEAKFVLCSPDGSETELSEDDLVFSDHLTVEDVDKKGWYEIETAATGKASVSYTENGSTYSVTINVTYPDLGLYTVEGTLVESITMDEIPETFCIALSPEKISQGYRMTALHPQADPDARYPDITEAGTVVISEDGSYAEITVTGPPTEKRYSFAADITNSNSGGTYSDVWDLTIRINSDLPMLYWCRLEENEKNERFDIDYSSVESELELNLYESEIMCFFFGTEEEIEEGTLKPLEWEELRFPGCVNDTILEKYKEYDDYTYPEEAAGRVEAVRLTEEDAEITYIHNGVRYSLPVTVSQPQKLFCQYLEWDDEDREYVPENRDIKKSRTTSIKISYAIGSFPVRFYYGTEDSMAPVDFEDLTFPEGVLNAEKVNDVVYLEPVAMNESGTITYDGGQKNCTMKVTVRQPAYALYSSLTTVDETTYLGEEIMLDGADHSTFYLIARDGEYPIETIREIMCQKADVTNQFLPEVAADGSYVTFTVNPEDMPFGEKGYHLWFIVSGEDDDGEPVPESVDLDFEVKRGDLTKLATPVNPVWHKRYERRYNENEEWYYITKDRMGSIGYEVYGLCQNRMNIEIYSSDDGYIHPVASPTWSFGSLTDRTHFSVTTFIYADLPSGTYKFRVRSIGDGTKYTSSDWSEMSPEFVYVKPAAQLDAPDSSAFYWEKTDYGYTAVWSPEDMEQPGADCFEVEFYYMDPEEGELSRIGRNHDVYGDCSYIGDDILEEHGATDYYFRVRVIPTDITQYCSSEWSGYSPALKVDVITNDINDVLEDLLLVKDEPLDVQNVQNTLQDQTADLRTAMAADLEISGGVPSGTLELIRQLEDAVEDNVEQKVEAKNSAPQAIQDIASGITMVGATLNLADKNPETGETPTVTLELDEPKKGIVIDEQQHNAVQFSMKLKGAIDKDDKEQTGLQLIVPVVIDMPVPKGINPDFLVVLHKLWDGRIEWMHPYIYLHSDGRYHAVFVVDSFSDFALVEYTFRFETETVSKQVGDAPFTLTASGCADDCSVIYRSSDPSIAEVDESTGEVTIHRAGKVTITAIASATEIFPETKCSYVLTITGKTEPAEKEKSVLPNLCLYSVETEESIGGTVRAGARYAAVGSRVKLTVTPDEGYVLDTLTVFCGGREFTPEITNGRGYFVMHYADAVIKATFVKN